MDIIMGPFRLHEKYKGISIALGTFDGVHVGHRKIVERVVAAARERSGTSVVFTFNPHPRLVLKPDLPLPMITTYNEKQKIMAALGVDVLFVLPFHSDFAKMSPGEFVRDILVELVQPELVVVGSNYTFGHRGKGTPETLAKLGKQYGFRVKIEDPVFADGQMVSSTLIRRLINLGEVAKANELLARYFTISGEVVHGDGRGRKLGFPTANVAFSPLTLMPADGVYAAKVVVKNRRYIGVANVGANPTFHVNQRRLEVHLLDFHARIYGQAVTVEFVRRIREEKAFPHMEALIQQIKQDIISARVYLADHT